MSDTMFNCQEFSVEVSGQPLKCLLAEPDRLSNCPALLLNFASDRTTTLQTEPYDITPRMFVAARHRAVSFDLPCRGEREISGQRRGITAGDVAVVCANAHGRGQFWLPGGGMLAGESPEQTITREVREVRLHRKVGEAIQFFFAGDEDCWYRMRAYFFTAQFHGDADGRGEYKLPWVDSTLRRTDFFHECHVWAALDTTRP